MNAKTSFSGLLWLFKINLFISAFTFGGGYVVIPMIRKYFVLEKSYFSEDELLDMASVAQSSPGAIAINLAVLAGYRTFGFPGAVVSGISSVLPPLVILGAVSSCYHVFTSFPLVLALLRGMEASVGALIVDVVLDMGQTLVNEKQPFFTLIAPAAFFANFFFHIPVMYILFASIVLCLGKVYISRKQTEVSQ
ncbi:chromate transporter [Clostridium sp. AM58-1XD]|uniref:chromate transporter n=1 Tax=Clostridium sp. AM58-1XD TaxID=2292307 RepID=UPI000E4FA00D|nr:chromate transporter [Clostridium sp. AM58-1XD]RGY95440.1 chromate transporter [Clostridium sp. AM58-1XD]